jgi:hypothetical protein
MQYQENYDFRHDRYDLPARPALYALIRISPKSAAKIAVAPALHLIESFGKPDAGRRQCEPPVRGRGRIPGASIRTADLSGDCQQSECRRQSGQPGSVQFGQGRRATPITKSNDDLYDPRVTKQVEQVSVEAFAVAHGPWSAFLATTFARVYRRRPLKELSERR